MGSFTGPSRRLGKHTGSRSQAISTWPVLLFILQAYAASNQTLAARKGLQTKMRTNLAQIEYAYMYNCADLVVW